MGSFSLIHGYTAVWDNRCGEASLKEVIKPSFGDKSGKESRLAVGTCSWIPVSCSLHAVSSRGGRYWW